MKINLVGKQACCSDASQINFKARDYADVKTFVSGSVSSLKLYELDSYDSKFLDVVANRINLRQLSDLKNVTRRQFNLWKNVINNAILMSGFSDPQRSFLLTKNNRPCGILSFKDLQEESYIDYISTWPISKGKNVKLAGTVLMKTAFDIAKENDTKKISLTLLSDSPFDLTKFYKNLSFQDMKTKSVYDADLVSYKSDYVEKSKELEKIIEINKSKSSEDVDLKRILDINY